MTNQEKGVIPQALSPPAPTHSSEVLLTDGFPTWGRLGQWGVDLSSPLLSLAIAQYYLERDAETDGQPHRRLGGLKWQVRRPDLL